MENPRFLECAGISADDLAGVVNSSSSTTLQVIDARPYSEFTVSHIQSALTIRLATVVVKRLLGGKLAIDDLISNPETWRKRTSDTLVVCYDNTGLVSDKVAFNSECALHILLLALQREGVSCVYLTGGFNIFQSKYQHLVQSSAPATTSLPTAPTSLFSQVPQTPRPPALSLPCFTSMSSTRNPFPCAPPSSTPISPVSEILPHVYIGCRQDAANRGLLGTLNITFILNLTADCPNFFQHESTFQYQQIPIMDTWNQNIQNYFSIAFEFLDQAKAHNTRCLVHCSAGISRSSAFVIAYIMKTLNMTLNQSYEYVKARRSIISPNLDFMGELQDYERQLTAARTSSDSKTKHPTGPFVNHSHSLYIHH